MLDLDEPVIGGAVGVSYDVVEDYEPFELQLVTVLDLAGQGLDEMVLEKGAGFRVSFDEELERSHFQRQPYPRELPPDHRERLQHLSLDSRFRPDDGGVIEGLAGQANDPRLRDYPEPEVFIDDTSSYFGQVTPVRNQTASAETARTTSFLNPFDPFRVHFTVWFFIFRFEDGDISSPVTVLNEVTPAGTLQDPLRVHPVFNGLLCFVYDQQESRIVRIIGRGVRSN